jgi:DNA-binding MarR family transcriptional regulator
LERFTRHFSIPPRRPLTPAQERSLVALASLCPGLGEEASAAAIAAASGIRHGATTLALRGLERRRLVTGHGEDSDPRVWAPTLTGRAEAKRLAARPDPEPRHWRDDARDETGGG